MIEYPITITKIVHSKDGEPYARGYRGDDVGNFVAVRPCGCINPDGKTYLGIYLGEMRVLGGGFEFFSESGELHTIPKLLNPAIYIFDLRHVVFGYESWWAIINSEDDLAQISDEDIQNVWYVRALKQLQEN